MTWRAVHHVGMCDRRVYGADHQEKIKSQGCRNNTSGVEMWAEEPELPWQGCLPVEPDLYAPSGSLRFNLGAMEQEVKLPSST